MAADRALAALLTELEKADDGFVIKDDGASEDASVDTDTAPSKLATVLIVAGTMAPCGCCMCDMCDDMWW